jgi:hypothetical protein
MHHGMITGGEKAKASWRVLFAEALIAWQQSKQEGKPK